MLDNTVILWTSEFSTGSDHSVANLPMLLAGKGAGRMRTNAFIDYNLKAKTDPATRDYLTDAGLHNVFTSILNMFDFPDANWGAPSSDVTSVYGHTTSLYKQGPLPGVAF